MSIFNQDQRTAFLALVSAAQGAGKSTDPDILAYLNQPSVLDNPAPQGQVPRVMAESEVASLLSADSLKAVLNWVNFALVKADIESNNHIGVSLWAMKLALLALITSDEATAVAGYTSGTVSDPQWQAHVSGPSPFQSAFSGVVFALPEGGSTIDNATQSMLGEVQ